VAAGGAGARRESGGQEVCVVPPGHPGEEYSVELEEGGVVHLLLGSCSLDGVQLTPACALKFTPGMVSTPL